jgi:hypothetical protein
MSEEDFNTVTVGVQVRDDVVVISDPEDGSTSISNAIDSVLAQVYAQNPDAPRVVLYRDAEGVYDGVAVDDEGQFQNFYPIKTRDADHAAEVAVAFIVEAPARFH